MASEEISSKYTRSPRLKSRADSSIAATRIQQIQAAAERLAWSGLLWRTMSIFISVSIVILAASLPVALGLLHISFVIFFIWSAEKKRSRSQQVLLYEVTRQSENKYVDDIDENFVNIQYDISTRYSSHITSIILNNEPFIWIFTQILLFSLQIKSYHFDISGFLQGVR